MSLRERSLEKDRKAKSGVGLTEKFAAYPLIRSKWLNGKESENLDEPAKVKYFHILDIEKIGKKVEGENIVTFLVKYYGSDEPNGFCYIAEKSNAMMTILDDLIEDIANGKDISDYVFRIIRKIPKVATAQNKGQAYNLLQFVVPVNEDESGKPIGTVYEVIGREGEENELIDLAKEINTIKINTELF